MKESNYQATLAEETTAGTYNGIKAKPGAINAQPIEVQEADGSIQTHWITGNNREQAISLLVRTGWFLGSCRNIV